MISILSLLTVIVLSLLVVRIATVALTFTGISQQLARFQARSAFTGSGFTTTESEQVVQHPVRRRIIMLLMLLGNAGIITGASSLILSFLGTDDEGGVTSRAGFRLAVLAAGLLLLFVLAHSSWLDHRISRTIAWALRRWTDLEVRDYAGLLQLAGDFAVVELQVSPDDWLAGRQLKQLRLDDEGVLVLGIQKPQGVYLGAPRGTTELAAGDTVVLYGRRETLARLDQRRQGSEGNWQHHMAVEQQHQVEQDEERISEDLATEGP